MVDMQLTNNKLVNRAVRMVISELGVSQEEAETLIQQHGSVRAAILFGRSGEQQPASNPS